MFAGGTVSPIMRPVDGKQKDDDRGQTEDEARRGQRQGAEYNSRPQQGGLLSFRLFLLGVLVDPV